MPPQISARSTFAQTHISNCHDERGGLIRERVLSELVAGADLIKFASAVLIDLQRALTNDQIIISARAYTSGRQKQSMHYLQVAPGRTMVQTHTLLANNWHSSLGVHVPVEWTTRSESQWGSGSMYY